MDPKVRLAAAMARMPDFIVGGAACLDFANTVEPRGGIDSAEDAASSGRGDPRRDYLLEYGDLIAWSHAAGLLSEEEALRLVGRADAHPDAAAALFDAAIALREAIYRIFLAISRSESPIPTDLTAVEAAYHRALSHTHLTQHDGGFAWTWPSPHPDPSTDLESPLWPVARSAVDLLTTADPRRIKACPGVPGSPAPCMWLFYDTSKSRTRRWCTMADCGGHTKAQRLTARRRSARSGEVS